jgi:hypothetical protein
MGTNILLHEYVTVGIANFRSVIYNAKSIPVIQTWLHAVNTFRNI